MNLAGSSYKRGGLLVCLHSGLKRQPKKPVQEVSESNQQILDRVSRPGEWDGVPLCNNPIAGRTIGCAGVIEVIPEQWTPEETGCGD